MVRNDGEGRAYRGTAPNFDWAYCADKSTYDNLYALSEATFAARQKGRPAVRESVEERCEKWMARLVHKKLPKFMKRQSRRECPECADCPSTVLMNPDGSVRVVHENNECPFVKRKIKVDGKLVIVHGHNKCYGVVDKISRPVDASRRTGGKFAHNFLPTMHMIAEMNRGVPYEVVWGKHIGYVKTAAGRFKIKCSTCKREYQERFGVKSAAPADNLTAQIISSASQPPTPDGAIKRRV